jgi:hypothetical protein
LKAQPSSRDRDRPGRSRLGACLAWAGAILFVCHGELLAAERTALALTGAGCGASRQAIIHGLEQLDGVARVEANLIPDHLLIDHRAGAVTGEALAAFFGMLTKAGGPCRAAVMRSCITAGTEAPPAFSSAR